MIDKFSAKHLKANYMQTSGSALLKLMQNKETPVLDLFVRESIQNSLDASLADADEAIVNFLSGNFDVKSLAEKYSVIGSKLIDNYGKNNSFISIADKNTIGLIGNRDGLFKKGEDNQNLGKLVFQIMDPQTKAGAGGCWGIGKTVYYRLGIGLIIYYSRIKTLNGYEERLISTLVEDERSETRLITDEDDYIGITYFGDLIDNNPSVICDKAFIVDTLKCFNIKPYENDETGTVIIIPFIDKSKLLGDIKYNENDKPFWKSSVIDYMEMSILRWYYPRLNTKYAYKPRLTAYVNGKTIAPNENSPLFSKLSNMYECIIEGKEKDGISIYTIERSQDLEDTVLGYLAFVKLTKFELKTIGSNAEENLPSPFCYAGKLTEVNDQNPPLISFFRKPGMIVSYETSGDWVGSGISAGEGFIIGLFVLNSDNKFKNSKLTLEEYIRGSEKADHTSWADYYIENNKNQKWIVRSITNVIANKMKETFADKRNNEEISSTNRYLGKKFADLLPTYGFGKESSIDGRGRAGASIGKSKSTSVKMMGNPIFDKNGMRVNFEVTSKGNFKSLELFVQVSTTSSMIKLNEWEDDGFKCPCDFEKVFVITDKILPKTFKAKDGEVFEDSEIIPGGLKIELLKTQNDVIYGLKLINLGIESFRVTLAINLKIVDNTYQISFLSSIKEEDAI